MKNELNVQDMKKGDRLHFCCLHNGPTLSAPDLTYTFEDLSELPAGPAGNPRNAEEKQLVEEWEKRWGLSRYEAGRDKYHIRVRVHCECGGVCPHCPCRDGDFFIDASFTNIYAYENGVWHICGYTGLKTTEKGGAEWA